MSLRPLETGDRVRRGPDWIWGDQDVTPGNLGTVTSPATFNNQIRPWITVCWKESSLHNYPYFGSPPFLNNKTKEINMTATQTILPMKSGKKNFLSFIQKNKLADWLKSIGETAQTKSAHELATLATESLSFTVSPGNVSGMRTQLGLNPGQGACQRRTKVRKVQAEQLELLMRHAGNTLKCLETAAEALTKAREWALSLHRMLESLK